MAEEIGKPGAPADGAVLIRDEDTTATRKVRVSLVEDRPLTPETRQSLQAVLVRLAVPQKIELATKGNREVRAILSRDASVVVARAVMASPRLAEADVLAYAASPLTNEEILRAIADSRAWARNLRIQTLLVSNPRTPAPVARRFLGYLPVAELRLLARNRNVSPAVRGEAKRRLATVRR